MWLGDNLLPQPHPHQGKRTVDSLPMTEKTREISWKKKSDHPV